MKRGARPRRAAKPGKPPADRVIDVTVVMLDGGYASTAIGPIEVFHSAGWLWPTLRGGTPQPRFRVAVASIDGGSVGGPGALTITPPHSLAEIAHADIVILGTAGLDRHAHVARDARLIGFLRKWHARGAYVAGVCSSAAFLAEAGLLDGREATTHWAMADDYRRRFPATRWRPDQFVTEDKRVICSGGVYAAFDLSLYLVEKFCGHDVALECAKSLLLSMPRRHQLGYAALPLARPHDDDRIRAAEEFLQANYARDISIEQLAERAAMGPRNFIRRFKAATGRLPGAYQQMLRIAAAKELLEHGAASIQSVCSKIGYEDVAFFRTLFKRYTGMTPGEYRDRFSGMSFDRGDTANEPAAA